MINFKRQTYFASLYMFTLFVFGIVLIVSSIINFFSLKDYADNQKVVRLTPEINVQGDNFILGGNINNNKIKKSAPRFVVREDLSIKGISANFIFPEDENKNKLSTDKPVILSDLDHETALLNKKIPTLDLQKLPNNPLINLIDVKTKKEKFIALILPAVVKQNEEIRTNRKKLLEIMDYLTINRTLNKDDQHFLESTASKYNINTVNKHKIDTIKALLELVDEIPNSIVLAQAANESGWGTSRFAKEFNAFFGEYTFDINNGVAPIFRNDGEKHLIKFFSNIDESIESYFNNLNTHLAYKNFRISRKELRKINLTLDPMILVKYLKPYAKDKNYVKNIKSIIKSNKLTQFDSLKTITTKS